MQQVFLDTNVVVSFLINRSKEQTVIIQEQFELAKAGKLQLILTTEVLAEVTYILFSLQQTHAQTAKNLLSILKTEYIFIPDREAIILALGVFAEKQIDLVDCILFAKAKLAAGKAFSFDSDFKKLL
ncbi:MAG: PIN domain-containing protein [bacterium]|nr:PIN domain-containing protein [bacterium]